MKPIIRKMKIVRHSPAAQFSNNVYRDDDFMSNGPSVYNGKNLYGKNTSFPYKFSLFKAYSLFVILLI